MEIKIISVGVAGKSFFQDLESGDIYYMDKRGDDVRQSVNEDFHPMNTQGVFIDDELFSGKTFDSLESARKYASKLSLENTLSFLRFTEPAKQDLQKARARLLRTLEAELELYQ